MNFFKGKKKKKKNPTTKKRWILNIKKTQNLEHTENILKVSIKYK